MEQYESKTVKGHGLSLGDRFNFHGMGRDLPTVEGTEVTYMGMVGTKCQVATVAEPIMTWEFGTSAKIWASPAIEEVQATPVTRATPVADIDGGDVEAARVAIRDNIRGRIFVAECHNWAPKAAFDLLVESGTHEVTGDGDMAAYRRKGAVVTDADMRAQVVEALAGRDSGLVTATIVDTVQGRYGTVDIETIPSDEFWSIVSDCAWEASETEIWAGTKTLLKPAFRTLMGKRSRRSARRARRGIKGGF